MTREEMNKKIRNAVLAVILMIFAGVLNTCNADNFRVTEFITVNTIDHDS